MQLLLNPANIESMNNGSSNSKNNKTLKKKVNFMNNGSSSGKHESEQKKIDKKLLASLTNENNEDNEDNEDDTHIKEMYSNYNDLYNETTINNIRNTIMNSVKKTNSDYSEDNEISDLKNDSKSNYNENYKLNYNDFNNNNNNNNNIINNNNKLLDKIDYIIHLLEEQHNEKTNNITEELILYLFLGIFIIYVLDSFSRMSKYKR